MVKDTLPSMRCTVPGHGDRCEVAHGVRASWTKRRLARWRRMRDRSRLRAISGEVVWPHDDPHGEPATLRCWAIPE